jgi:Heterokaryon incompatibility protein (HET)
MSLSAPLVQAHCTKCLRGSVSPAEACCSFSQLTHKPLTGPLTTRVFELFRGKSNALIRGKLHEISLQPGNLPYICLSYTWGDTDRPHLIECDGCWARITCNLYSALLRIRKENSSIRIFIDALSINQSTDESGRKERENQVKLMGKIFGTAQSVIVDLGDQSHNSDAVVDLLYKLSDLRIEKWNQILGPDNDDAPETDLPGFDHTIWEDFAFFCFRKWFERIWVVQEFALACELFIMIGSRSISPEVLDRGIKRGVLVCELQLSRSVLQGSKQPEVSHRVKRIHRSLAAAVQRLACFTLFRDSISDQEPLSLVNALDLTRRFQATNTRDRLYALMGVTNQHDTSTLHVDYSESKEGFSKRLTAALLKNDKVTILLYRLAALDSSQTSSWMVDPDNPRDYNILEDQITQDGSCTKFQAGGFPNRILSTCLNDDILVVRGWADEVIAEVSALYPLKSLSASSMGDTEEVGATQTGEWLRQTFSMFQKHAGNLSLAEALQVFYKTIAAEGMLLSRMGEGLDSESLNQHVHAFHSLLNGDDREVQLGQKYMKHVAAICRGRRFCVTQNAMPGLVPADTHIGDRVGVFQGTAIPYILRRKQECYRLIGTAYIYGVMHGESIGSEVREVGDIKLG